MSFARFRPRLTVRWMMGLVAIVALLFGAYDQLRVYNISNKYRRMAESLAKKEQRSREIDAMDDATRARLADEALDDPFLSDPDWNRRMIPWFERMKRKYAEAAEHPRRPVAPDEPIP